MGRISLSQLLPLELRDRDRARPVGRIGLPVSAMAMRSGYQRNADGAPVFDGETKVSIRMLERAWTYKQPPATSLRTVKCWRIEFGVALSDAEPVRAGHHAVVAQEPYGNSWHQNAAFKMYSKKKPAAALCFDVPTGEKDPVAWIERSCSHDPWERNATFVAGFSSSSGSVIKEKPRNRAGDLVLGICPDFDSLVNEIFATSEIRRLIRLTKQGRIRFWNLRKVKNRPTLHQELMAECDTLMFLSIRQALAGPRKDPETWVDRPVWQLVDQIYRDHLNERNRTLQRSQYRESAPITSILYR